MSVGIDLYSTASSGLKAAGGAFAPKSTGGTDMAKGDKSKAGGGTSSDSGGSFLTKPVTESVPQVKWWMALLGVVGTAGGVYLWKKK